MGRRTFREIENLSDAGNIYPTTRNFVFTHAERLPIAGFTPVNGDVVEFVRQLGTEKNIWIIGGNTVLAPLLDADMVDQIIIQIAPVLLGDGIPLFAQEEALKRFHLDEVKKYGQFAELIYRKR